MEQKINRAPVVPAVIIKKGVAGAKKHIAFVSVDGREINRPQCNRGPAWDRTTSNYLVVATTGSQEVTCEHCLQMARAGILGHCMEGPRLNLDKARQIWAPRQEDAALGQPVQPQGNLAGVQKILEAIKVASQNTVEADQDTAEAIQQMCDDALAQMLHGPPQGNPQHGRVRCGTCARLVEVKREDHGMLPYPVHVCLLDLLQGKALVKNTSDHHTMACHVLDSSKVPSWGAQ